jgi:hypothetical protein
MYAAMLKSPNLQYSKVGSVCSEALSGAIYDPLGTLSGRLKLLVYRCNRVLAGTKGEQKKTLDVNHEGSPGPVRPTTV